jgi:cell division cycle protein 20 (cofactor of APC complex)
MNSSQGLSSNAITPSKTPKKSRSESNIGGGNNENCRFIPNRNNLDLDLAHSRVTKTPSKAITSSKDNINNSTDNTTKNTETSNANVVSGYNSALASTLNVESSDSSRILSFKEKAPPPKADTVNNLKVLYTNSTSSRSAKTTVVNRNIPSAPSRILDAPDLLDDYYLNLLSWSSTNVLAVALSQTVYLWNASSGDIAELCSLEGTPLTNGQENYICSVSWVQEGGGHLAIGTSNGKTQLWDTTAQKQLRSMDGHSERVGALSWNKHILSSGSRDGNIVNHDVRIAKHNVATLQCHTQEVCGLSWSPDGQTLASGGNDNKLCLWDINNSSRSGGAQQPRFQFTEHQAAVKALAWSPHERNLLASGGGTADRCIKFWNSQSGSLLNSIDTESQVCALQWNPHANEILSSHGFAKNQICLWKYPTMAKIKELNGHSARVLHMCTSPDGGSVVSAAADETLRFWDVFGGTEHVMALKRKAKVEEGAKAKKLSKTMHIR